MPGYTFNWKRIGSLLPSGRSLQKDCLLFIRNVTLQDAGVYRCIAENSVLGTELIEQAQLIVLGILDIELMCDCLARCRLEAFIFELFLL